MGKKEKAKKPMTKKKKLKRILIIEGVLLVLVIAGAVMAPMAARLIKGYNSLERTEVKHENIGINEEIESEKIEEYTNIAVFGLDSRQNSLKNGLSDMIMIASINNETKEVKVISVYRDTYLMWKEENGKMKFRKATEVYNQGGYEMSLKMLNTNFDLNITDFITVNFEAVYKAIDAVGGVEIDVDSREKSDINRYIDELNKINGTKSKHITKTGVQLLDGIQATAYGRIRYIDSDYARAERQREVLMELFKKVKGSSMSTLTALVEQLAPKVLTSLSDGEILDLVKDVASYEIVDQAGFPFEHGGGNHGGKGWIVTVNNLNLSVKQLHEYLFGDKEYEPSEKVKEISAAMDKDLGRQENTETTMYSSSSAANNDEKEGETTKAGARRSGNEEEE